MGTLEVAVFSIMNALVAAPLSEVAVFYFFLQVPAVRTSCTASPGARLSICPAVRTSFLAFSISFSSNFRHHFLDLGSGGGCVPNQARITCSSLGSMGRRQDRRT